MIPFVKTKRFYTIRIMHSRDQNAKNKGAMSQRMHTVTLLCRRGRTIHSPEREPECEEQQSNVFENAHCDALCRTWQTNS